MTRKLILVETEGGVVQAVHGPADWDYEYVVVDWDAARESYCLHCPLCQSEDLTVKLTRGDTDYCYHCEHCGTDFEWDPYAAEAEDEEPTADEAGS